MVLIAFEGIDGAGKSTVSRLLVQALRKDGFNACLMDKSSPQMMDGFARSQMDRLRQLIWAPPEGEPDEDSLGTHFYLFLIAAWWAGIQRNLLRNGDPEQILVADGWFYRTMIKARIRSDLSDAWLSTLFNPVSKPDLVLLLDAPPEVIWSRREKFKPSELGLWDGLDSADTFSAFCKYQQKVRHNLLELARIYDWIVLNQSEPRTVQELCEMAVEVIKNILKPRRGRSQRVRGASWILPGE